MLAALLLAASAFAACSGEAQPEPEFTTVHVGDATFHAEVVLTRSQRALGLSNRDTLAPDGAMVFVFATPNNAALWMKDMRFPLDFIWVSADKRVVKVDQNVPAPTEGQTQLPRYRSGQDIQYILEVNAGTVEELGIATGDAVTFDPEVDPAGAQ
jgi:hypothetical protein